MENADYVTLGGAVEFRTGRRMPEKLFSYK